MRLVSHWFARGTASAAILPLLNAVRKRRSDPPLMARCSVLAPTIFVNYTLPEAASAIPVAV